MAGNGSDSELLLWVSLRESASMPVFYHLKDTFTNYLMLSRERIDVCWKNHTTQVNYNVGKMQVKLLYDVNTGDCT